MSNLKQAKKVLHLVTSPLQDQGVSTLRYEPWLVRRLESFNGHHGDVFSLIRSTSLECSKSQRISHAVNNNWATANLNLRFIILTDA